MPIGPKQFEEIREAALEKLIEEIDTYLSKNAGKLEFQDDPVYLSFVTRLKDYEKSKIIDVYEQAGWRSVEILDDSSVPPNVTAFKFFF